MDILEKPTAYGIYRKSRFDGKRFIDLGSGLGHIVKAFQDMGFDAWGVEGDKGLYEQSLVRDKIINDDLFNVDLSPYQVGFYYLKGCKKEPELIDKLNKEFKGLLLINYEGCDRHHVDVFIEKLTVAYHIL